MLTGFSIETPDCPPNPNFHRGKVRVLVCLYVDIETTPLTDILQWLGGGAQASEGQVMF